MRSKNGMRHDLAHLVLQNLDRLPDSCTLVLPISQVLHGILKLPPPIVLQHGGKLLRPGHCQYAQRERDGSADSEPRAVMAIGATVMQTLC